jgi:hypothetical protein
MVVLYARVWYNGKWKAASTIVGLIGFAVFCFFELFLVFRGFLVSKFSSFQSLYNTIISLALSILYFPSLKRCIVFFPCFYRYSRDVVPLCH